MTSEVSQYMYIDRLTVRPIFLFVEDVLRLGVSANYFSNSLFPALFFHHSCNQLWNIAKAQRKKKWKVSKPCYPVMQAKFFLPKKQTGKNRCPAGVEKTWGRIVTTLFHPIFEIPTHCYYSDRFKPWCFMSQGYDYEKTELELLEE